MKQNNTNSFGANLKALRKKSGLTQEELADRLEVTSKTISNWELGSFIPTVDDVKKLAEALGVSEQQLLAPDTRPSGWVLTVRMVHDYREEVIDVSKDIPRTSKILTDNSGGFLVLGGSYELWKDDNQFKKLISDLKKYRFTVLQNGRDHGAIKD